MQLNRLNRTASPPKVKAIAYFVLFRITEKTSYDWFVERRIVSKVISGGQLKRRGT